MCIYNVNRINPTTEHKGIKGTTSFCIGGEHWNIFLLLQLSNITYVLYVNCKLCSMNLCTLSPSRRLIPSSSMKAEACKVVSCLSSSLFPFGERRHQVTTNPREPFSLLPSNAHFNNTLRPESSARISGSDGAGGCLSAKRKGEWDQLFFIYSPSFIKMSQFRVARWHLSTLE